MKKIVIFMLITCMWMTGCAKEQSSDELLDPDHPVVITLWHYYNGSQKTAFDALVKEFNETVGQERGIFVESHNQGNVTQLEASVMDAIDKKVGSQEVPNLFASYADTAYTIEKKGYLVDLSQYLTEEELLTYTDSFIQEGRIGKNNELKILPVAKSSEIFLINQTDWDVFSQATGTTLEELKTKEGLVLVAQKYYEWTDSLTPDIPEDGRAFYGRDAMANLFIVGSMQLGHEIFKVENQQVQVDVNQDVIRRIWDFYYIPYIKGYFSSYGKFRSDDIKIGQIIAQTGSSTSVQYFPDFVENNGETRDIDALALPEPPFEGGKPYAVQQGAGMVVTTSTKAKEYASMEFLKWFTENERNLRFSVRSGYLPVKKDAVDTRDLDQVLDSEYSDVAPLVRDAMVIGFETLQSMELYTNKAFDKGTDARKVLEYHLSDQAAADRKEVEERLKQGMTLEEATKPYTSEQYFQSWFDSFQKALMDSVES